MKRISSKVSIVCFVGLLLIMFGCSSNALDAGKSYSADKKVLPSHFGKLLWEKTIKTYNVAVNDDGSRIAVTVFPTCASKSGTDYFRTTGCSGTSFCKDSNCDDQNAYCSKMSCENNAGLYLFDGKGNLLWNYSSKDNKDILGIYNASISNDGKLVAASVSKIPCHDESWQVNLDQYGQFVGTGTLKFEMNVDLGNAAIGRSRYANRRPPGVAGNYTLFERGDRLYARVQSVTKKVEVCKRETVLFDENGRVLWSQNGRGLPKISPDGKYVLVMPYVSLQHTAIYGNSWQLISSNGKLLMERKVVDDPEVEIALRSDEDMFTKGPFSSDSQYFVFTGDLWTYNDGHPRKIDIPGVPSDTSFLRLASDGLYALSSDMLVDVAKRQIVSSLSDGPYFEPPGIYLEHSVPGIEAFEEKHCERKVVFARDYVLKISATAAAEADDSGEEVLDDVMGNIEVYDLGKGPKPLVIIKGPFSSLYQNKLPYLVGRLDSKIVCAYSLPAGEKMWCSAENCKHNVMYGDGKGLLCVNDTRIINYRIMQ